jgi:hypothetical protein
MNLKKILSVECDINGYPICERKPKEVIIGDDEQLRYPHYSNANWKGSELIYGKEKEGIHVDYDDRLRDFNYDQYDIAHETASRKCKHNTPGWWKEFVNIYFGKPTTIHYIMAGSNLSNGHPYWVLGYSFDD